MNRHHLYCILLSGVMVYIGVAKNPVIRFRRHCRAKNAIGRAIRRNINPEIQILVVGDRSYIYDLESKAISLFGMQYPKGFNLYPGGIGGRSPLVSTRDKISNALKGHTISPETRRKISASLKGNINTLGYKHSVAARLNMSAGRHGMVLSAAHKENISKGMKRARAR